MVETDKSIKCPGCGESYYEVLYHMVNGKSIKTHYRCRFCNITFDNIREDDKYGILKPQNYFKTRLKENDGEPKRKRKYTKRARNNS